MADRHAWVIHQEKGLQYCAGAWPATTEDDEVLMCMERWASEEGKDWPDGMEVWWSTEWNTSQHCDECGWKADPADRPLTKVELDRMHLAIDEVRAKGAR